jgi:hypothetical protein
VCADFNDDGWIDIYATNDQSLNFLFVNNGNGTFREEADIAGVCRGMTGQGNYSGMGVDCADSRNDGKLSVAIANFQYEPITLYRSSGKGTFSSETATSGMGANGDLYVKWGLKFVDLDMDGWQDLFVANGQINDRLEKARFLQPCQIFRNMNGTFTDVSAQSGSFFTQRQVGRGAAFGDYDNDGDTDVLVGCNNQPAILLRNDSPQSNHWIRLTLQGSARDLHGSGCNRDALGARVQVRANGMTQTQYVRSGTSYLCDHDRRLLFGIGQDEQAQVEVKWPCGSIQKVQVQSGKAITIQEADCKLAHKSSPSSMNKPHD